MILEIFLWIIFLLLACVGNATRTVAASVRDLQPTLLAARASREGRNVMPPLIEEVKKAKAGA